MNEAFSFRDRWKWGVLIVQFIWHYVYFATAVAANGRTLGKALAGLKVNNNNDGLHVKLTRVAIRTFFVCIDLWSFIGLVSWDFSWLWLSIWGGLELLCGLLRQDRRQIHDLLAGTCVVYSWDARLAQFREELEQEEEAIRIKRASNDVKGSIQPLSIRRRARFWRPQSNMDDDPITSPVIAVEGSEHSPNLSTIILQENKKKDSDSLGDQE